MPVLRIDHVFVTRDIAITNAFAPYDALTRQASDHLPLVIDFETVGSSASGKGLEPAASERI
jgi:endonuclease/exonuclease/phosphatase family metal-dependent hydrolase